MWDKSIALIIDHPPQTSSPMLPSLPEVTISALQYISFNHKFAHNENEDEIRVEILKALANKSH